MRLPKRLTPHTVSVAAFLGEGARGSIWAAPVTVSNVYVEDVQEVVRDSQGAEVVSRGKVFFNVADAPAEGSKVTTWAGATRESTATVFKVSVFDHPSAASHAVAYLK